MRNAGSLVVGSLLVTLFSCSGPQQSFEVRLEDSTKSPIQTFVPDPARQIVLAQDTNVKMNLDNVLASIDNSANPEFANFIDKQEKVAFSMLNQAGFDSEENNTSLLSCYIPTSLMVKSLNRVISTNTYYLGSSDDLVQLKQQLGYELGTPISSIERELDILSPEDENHFAFISGAIVLGFQADVTGHKIDISTRSAMSGQGSNLRGIYGDSWLTRSVIGGYLIDSIVYRVDSFGGFTHEQVAAACSYNLRTDLSETSTEKTWARWVLGDLNVQEKTNVITNPQAYFPAQVQAIHVKRISSQITPSGSISDFVSSIQSQTTSFIDPTLVFFDYKKYTESPDF